MRSWGRAWQTTWGTRWGAPETRLSSWGTSWETSWLETWGEVQTPQVLVPVQDISAGAWLSSTGASLVSTIDEELSSDSDYDFTRSHSTMEVKFGSGNDPSASTGHVLSYRLKGNGTTDAIVSLKQGAAVIATWTELNVPTTPTDFSHILTGPQADSITNYSDLRFSIEAA